MVLVRIADHAETGRDHTPEVLEGCKSHSEGHSHRVVLRLEHPVVEVRAVDQACCNRRYEMHPVAEEDAVGQACCSHRYETHIR